MSLTWVPYAKGSPTVAANAVATKIRGLIADGEQRDMANFGQGREQISLDADLQDMVVEKFTELSLGGKFFNAGYNITADVGGTTKQRDIARQWLRRFIGIDDETFILPTTGRIALNETFKMYRGHELVAPFEHWPMIETIAADYGVSELRSYALTRGKLGEGIEEATYQPSGLSSNLTRQIWYIGTPSNPRGLVTTAREMQALLDLIKNGIAQGGADNKPVLLFDIPYFHAAAQSVEPGKPFLDLGLSPAFFDELKAMNVSYVASFSFSKAFGAATPGLSFMTVSPDLVANMRAQMVRDPIGISYSPQMHEAMMTLFNGRYDQEILNHFGKLRENYRINCEALEYELNGVTPALRIAFGKVADYSPMLLDGDPAMTRLIQLPKEGIIGRVVDVPEEFSLPGNTLEIKTVTDLLTYMANVAGVVMVDNGLSADEKSVLIRVATAEPTEKFARGCERLAKSLLTVARSARPA